MHTLAAHLSTHSTLTTGMRRCVALVKVALEPLLKICALRVSAGSSGSKAHQSYPQHQYQEKKKKKKKKGSPRG
jgi:hypothetical protein